MSAIGKNLQAFRVAVNSHDRENPTHTAYGIGLSGFDMERLGFDDGETLWEGITIHRDSGQSGMCRVPCDGEHAQPKILEAETPKAIGVEA
ncbi:MAG TPA: hypothetical protein VGF95_14225 [Solirubrobacteraceae bacterium]